MCFIGCRTRSGSERCELGTAGDDEVEVEPAVGARSVSWDRTIEVWFRLEYTNGEVRVVVAFAILYRRDSDVIVPRSVRDEFVNRVAFMATFPYLREAVQRLLADLRFGTVVLPLAIT